jgi:hypothetical protein
MPDGRLVVFEIETGMIVHDWDPPDLYPYKQDCARAICRATEAMIDAAIRKRFETCRALSNNPAVLADSP